VNTPIWSYQPVSDDVFSWLGTDPVPAAPYYDPDYFELEREAVFKRTWLQIGHVCEIPEPDTFIVRPVEVAKASILITHGKDGKIRAFHNACTHRGTQLVSDAEGARSSFTCPYHAWTFGYDGALRSAPDFERFYAKQDDCGLSQVAVDVCGGLIFINLDPAPGQSLREFLGPLAAKLDALPAAKATTFTEYVYEIGANWKITYDNFQETYHLRFIHARTTAAALSDANLFGYPIRYDFHGPHREKTIWSNTAAKPTPVQGFALGKGMAHALADGVAPGPHDKDYFQLFPNFFILGSPVQPFSHMVMPISATRSRGVIRFYWKGDDERASKRFVREYAMALGRDIHSEDVDIIQAGQRGLSSGALKHIHFQEQEVLLRHLYREVNDRVEAYQRNQRQEHRL
jgi:phenylpropionate dioxygenase-like ring-hydroxylating dioxygenase large terminal subunit